MIDKKSNECNFSIVANIEKIICFLQILQGGRNNKKYERTEITVKHQPTKMIEVASNLSKYTIEQKGIYTHTFRFFFDSLITHRTEHTCKLSKGLQIHNQNNMNPIIMIHNKITMF